MDLPTKCVPCKGATALTLEEARAYLPHTPGWTLAEGRLRHEYTLPDFQAALGWINTVASLAERAQHHPDLHLTGWNHVTLEIWTHTVQGLHPNDFVLAKQIDEAWARAEVSAG